MIRAVTPDVDRVPWGFEPEGGRHRWRARVGAAVLVDGAMAVGTALGGRVPTGRRASAERIWARSVARALDLEISTTGTEHIAVDEPMIVMPLHESFVDVVAVLHLPLDLVFTVRDELLDLASVGGYLRSSRQITIPTERTPTALRAFHRSVGETLESGESVVVFPQGSVLGIEIAFQPGVARLARSTGASILPVVLTGGHRIWEYPFGRTLRLGGRMEVQLLEPVLAGDASRGRLREIERTMKQRALAANAPARRFVPAVDGWWDDYDYAIDPDFADLHQAVERHRAQR